MRYCEKVNELALSVTCGDTSPKGRGKNLTGNDLALPLGELDA